VKKVARAYSDVYQSQPVREEKSKRAAAKKKKGPAEIKVCIMFPPSSQPSFIREQSRVNHSPTAHFGFSRLPCRLLLGCSLGRSRLLRPLSPQLWADNLIASSSFSIPLGRQPFIHPLVQATVLRWCALLVSHSTLTPQVPELVIDDMTVQDVLEEFEWNLDRFLPQLHVLPEIPAALS
jgi:hypothetical protein